MEELFFFQRSMIISCWIGILKMYEVLKEIYWSFILLVKYVFYFNAYVKQDIYSI